MNTEYPPDYSVFTKEAYFCPPVKLHRYLTFITVWTFCSRDKDREIITMARLVLGCRDYGSLLIRIIWWSAEAFHFPLYLVEASSGSACLACLVHLAIFLWLSLSNSCLDSLFLVIFTHFCLFYRHTSKVFLLYIKGLPLMLGSLLF